MELFLGYFSMHVFEYQFAFSVDIFVVFWWYVCYGHVFYLVFEDIFVVFWWYVFYGHVFYLVFEVGMNLVACMDILFML